LNKGEIVWTSKQNKKNSIKSNGTIVCKKGTTSAVHTIFVRVVKKNLYILARELHIDMKRDISESRFCGRRNNNFFDKEKFGLFSLKGGYCAFFEEIGPLFLEKIFTMDRNCERKMRLLRKIRITIAFFRRLLYNVEER